MNLDSLNINIINMKNSTIMFNHRYKSNFSSPRNPSNSNFTTILNEKRNSKAHLSMSKSRRIIKPPNCIPPTSRKHSRNKSFFFRLNRAKVNNFLSPNSKNSQISHNSKKNSNHCILPNIESKGETVIVRQKLFNESSVSSSNYKNSGKTTSNNKDKTSSNNHSSDSKSNSQSNNQSNNHTNKKASSSSNKSGQTLNNYVLSSKSSNLQSNENFEEYLNVFDGNQESIFSLFDKAETKVNKYCKYGKKIFQAKTNNYFPWKEQEDYKELKIQRLYDNNCTEDLLLCRFYKSNELKAMIYCRDNYDPSIFDIIEIKTLLCETHTLELICDEDIDKIKIECIAKNIVDCLKSRKRIKSIKMKFISKNKNIIDVGIQCIFNWKDLFKEWKFSKNKVSLIISRCIFKKSSEFEKFIDYSMDFNLYLENCKYCDLDCKQNVCHVLINK